MKLDLDTADLRKMLTRWPTGVCVITTLGSNGDPIGKAANSFHSVSLDPPLVAWCVDVGSTRYEDWLAAPGYVVHVLSEDQINLVWRFAKRGGDKFDGLDWTPNADGLPLLEGAALRLVCRTQQRHEAGDHTYLVGEVLSVDDYPNRSLLFYDGKPSTLSDLLEAHDSRQPTSE